MNIGDKITNLGGINATDIPLGTEVSYTCGVCQSSLTTIIRMRNGKKVLGLDNRPWRKPGDRYPDLFSHGQQGTMTVLSLPK